MSVQEVLGRSKWGWGHIHGHDRGWTVIVVITASCGSVAIVVAGESTQCHLVQGLIQLVRGRMQAIQGS